MIMYLFFFNRKGETDVAISVFTGRAPARLTDATRSTWRSEFCASSVADGKPGRCGRRFQPNRFPRNGADSFGSLAVHHSAVAVADAARPSVAPHFDEQTAEPSGVGMVPVPVSQVAIGNISGILLALLGFIYVFFFENSFGVDMQLKCTRAILMRIIALWLLLKTIKLAVKAAVNSFVDQSNSFQHYTTLLHNATLNEAKMRTMAKTDNRQLVIQFGRGVHRSCSPSDFLKHILLRPHAAKGISGLPAESTGLPHSFSFSTQT